MYADRVRALSRGARLEAAGMILMFVEATLAIGAGIGARSVLLTAFGFDSVIELLSAAALWRRLNAERASATPDEELELQTVRMSAVLLVLLCAYVVISSLVGLLGASKPEASPLGLAVAISAVITMPLIAWGKRMVNRVLDSDSMRADIAQTVTCAWLAAVTIAGLGASGLFGLSWAQYVAALGLLIWLVPETREALASAGWGRKG